MSEHSGAASISKRKGRVAAHLVALKKDGTKKAQHMLLEKDGSRKPAPFGCRKKNGSKNLACLQKKDGSRKTRALWGNRKKNGSKNLAFVRKQKRTGRENLRVCWKQKRTGREKPVLLGNVKKDTSSKPALFGIRKRTRRAKTRIFCDRKKEGFQNCEKQERSNTRTGMYARVSKIYSTEWPEKHGDGEKSSAEDTSEVWERLYTTSTLKLAWGYRLIKERVNEVLRGTGSRGTPSAGAHKESRDYRDKQTEGDPSKSTGMFVRGIRNKMGTQRIIMWRQQQVQESQIRYTGKYRHWQQDTGSTQKNTTQKNIIQYSAQRTEHRRT